MRGRQPAPLSVTVSSLLKLVAKTVLFPREEVGQCITVLICVSVTVISTPETRQSWAHDACDGWSDEERPVWGQPNVMSGISENLSQRLTSPERPRKLIDCVGAGGLFFRLEQRSSKRLRLSSILRLPCRSTLVQNSRHSDGR